MASTPWLARGSDGDEVAALSGMAPGIGELANNDDRRDPVPWGGEKMSLPRSSWLIPSSCAARCAAAGLRNFSLPL